MVLKTRSGRGLTALRLHIAQRCDGPLSGPTLRDTAKRLYGLTDLRLILQRPRHLSLYIPLLNVRSLLPLLFTLT